MTSKISPPRSLEEIPEKLFAAWKEFGSKLKDEHWAKFSECWGNSVGYLGIEEALEPRLRKEIPSHEFPEWFPALAEIINNLSKAEIEEKGDTLQAVMMHFLDLGQVYQLKPLHPAITKYMSINMVSIPKFVLRNKEEYQSVINVLKNTSDKKIAKHMLISMTKIQFAEMNDVRDDILIQELPSISTALLDFPYDNDSYGGDDAEQFCQNIKNLNVLKQVINYGGTALKIRGFYRVNELTWRNGEPEKAWDDFHEQIKKFAEAFVSARPSYISEDVINILWKSEQAKVSNAGVNYILDQIRECGHDESQKVDGLLSLAQEMLAEDELKFSQGALEGIGYLNLPEIHQFSKLQNKTLAPFMLESIAKKTYDYELDDYYSYYADDDFDKENHRHSDYLDIEKRKTVTYDIIRNLMLLSGDKISEIKPSHLTKLVHLIDTDELATALSKPLQAVTSKSKKIRELLPTGLAKVSPEVLDAQGWFSDKRKAVREVALATLVIEPNSDSVEYLMKLHDHPKTNDADKEQIISVLAKLPGAKPVTTKKETVPKSDNANTDLSEIIEKAEKAKIKPQIKRLWSDKLAECFSPVSEQVSQWALSIALETKEKELPKNVKKVIQQLSKEKRAQLVEHLVQLWVDSNGDAKKRYLLLFVPGHADDRIVPIIMDGFKKWNKRAKAKAVFALESIGSLNTIFALSTVYEVSSSVKYSHAIDTGANEVLYAAAERRGIKIFELLDLLTPDFGLKAGQLVLDVGPYNYLIALSQNLEITICNEKTGKFTKSFPKVKKTEDAEKHSLALVRYSLLKKHIKNTVKLQQPRFEELMLCERTWDAEIWQKLFAKNGLLNVIGQGIIWQTKEGQSFHVNSSSILLDSNGNSIELSKSDTISLWHPVHASEAEYKQWQSYLKENALVTFLNQHNYGSQKSTKEDVSRDSILAPDGLKLNPYTFKSILNKWKYTPYDQDSDKIFTHSKYYPYLKIRAVIEHESLDSYILFEYPVEVESFGFTDNKGIQISLESVPNTLIARVYDQIKLLKEKADLAERPTEDPAEYGKLIGEVAREIVKELTEK